jgi:hypothetical protein
MSETRDERIARIAALFPDGDLAYLVARLATAEADLAQIVNAPIAMTDRVPGGLVPLVRAVAAVAGRRHAGARLARREQS